MRHRRRPTETTTRAAQRPAGYPWPCAARPATRVHAGFPTTSTSGTTLGSRITRQPKVHLVDSGVAAWLLNLTPAKIAQGDPAVLTEYGHLLETFAVGEILKQVSWWEAPVISGHFRTGAGHEVDLVLERDDDHDRTRSVARPRPAALRRTAREGDRYDREVVDA